jgi:hypothetical protein
MARHRGASDQDQKQNTVLIYDKISVTWTGAPLSSRAA